MAKSNEEEKAEALKPIKIKTRATYNGHQITKAKLVELNLSFRYNQMDKYIKLVVLVGEELDVIAILDDAPAPLPLGTFVIKQLSVKQDGEAALKLVSKSELVQFDNITALAGDESEEPVRVMFKANIATKEEEEN